MQCKDIPDEPILKFLDGLYPEWATWFWSADCQWPNSVGHVVPPGTPEKLILAKMRRLIDRGLVSGCKCGCRGDFEITDKGREYLAAGGTSSVFVPPNDQPKTEMNVLWTLEFSQWSEDNDKFPFHIGRLSDTLRRNTADCLDNHRGPNKWQLVHIGAQSDCNRKMHQLIETKEQGTWNK